MPSGNTSTGRGTRESQVKRITSKRGGGGGDIVTFNVDCAQNCTMVVKFLVAISVSWWNLHLNGEPSYQQLGETKLGLDFSSSHSSFKQRG